MPNNYYFIDGSVSAGQSTLLAISNESSTFGIGATSSIDAGIITATSLKVGTEVAIQSGIVTATNGFISIGNTTPIQISLVGNKLTFSAVGIGSTTFTLS